VIYQDPVNLFVAAFIGSPSMNFVRANLRREGDQLVCRLRSQDLVLPPEALGTRPGLAAYEGRDVAVGVRPEHLLAQPANGAPTLKVTTVRSEMLGAERLIHATLEADAVTTVEMVEAAADEPADAVGALFGNAERDRLVTLIARADPAFVVDVGTELEFGINAARLHFFDLDSGIAIT